VRLANAAVLDKPGQVFEPAIYGSLRVNPSESGFYGSQVREIRIIGRLGFHQEVVGLIKNRKLLILREVVGAKGFEPSTSWSRTRNKNHLSRCPGVSYGSSSRSLLDKFGQVAVEEPPSEASGLLCSDRRVRRSLQDCHYIGHRLEPWRLRISCGFAVPKNLALLIPEILARPDVSRDWSG